MKAQKSDLEDYSRKIRGSTIPNRKVKVLSYQKKTSDLTLRDAHTRPPLHTGLYGAEKRKGNNIHTLLITELRSIAYFKPKRLNFSQHYLKNNVILYETI